MKKIFLLCLLCCFCITGTVNADIRKRMDDFDESLKIRSVRQDIGDFAQFNFLKNIETSGDISFQVYASTDFWKKNDFAKDYAEVKIDQKVFKVNVIKIGRYRDTLGGILPISSTIEIPMEAIESLKSAQKVALRLHREDGYQDIAEVPSEVLEEWKEVINTQE